MRDARCTLNPIPPLQPPTLVGEPQELDYLDSFALTLNYRDKKFVSWAAGHNE